MMKPSRIFSRDSDGAVAVEFALVIPLLLAIVFSIIETGWLFLRVSLLEDAVADVSRVIYTGQANDQAAIETAVCSRLTSVIDNCPSNITVELRVIDDSFTPPDEDAVCLDASDPGVQGGTTANPTLIRPAVDYNSAQGDDTVFVRVCVTTDVVSPILKHSINLPKNDQGRLQLVSSFAFRNEPF